ncbi:unnamed protein product [Fraxinus pennsylvanica]|uniref:GTD-binding domain-containing protein n=1 Tax=Fraxinus pennsylvanica TaxID=56036 RepID=A0AAD1YZB7_9LAMI|nr:unnamed protein product [Fraxinus pennsylvanica]
MVMMTVTRFKELKPSWFVRNDDDDDDDDEKAFTDKVEEFDITELRKLVKIERKRANVAYAELEKEMAASATAAEEAMGMILRLQNERRVIEMEANRYRNLAEKKQLHDQEVIRSLKWLLLNHSPEKCFLEDHLRLCRKKSKHFVKNDEKDGDGEEEKDIESRPNVLARKISTPIVTERGSP